MAQSAIYDFSKGMNNHVIPSRLPEGVARLIKNARISNMAITPIAKAQSIGVVNPEDKKHYGWVNRSVVKWYERYYWSINDANGSSPYYGGDEYPIGIASPDILFNISITSIPYSNFKANTTYKYCITQLNEDSWESAPKDISEGIRYIALKPNEWMPLITVGTPESWVKEVRVYRTVGGGSTFYLLRSLKPEECGTSFNDTTSDEYLPFNASLETYSVSMPPDNGKYLTEKDGTFYLAVGDRLYSSMQNNPHAWNMLKWIGFEDEITGVTQEYQGLLVFTANRCYRVAGSDLANAYKQEIPVEQGCVNWRTIARIWNSPIWVSNDGICVWDGQNVMIITLDRYDIDSQNTKFAFVANDRYNLIMNDGTCVVFDMRAGKIFYQRYLPYDYGWYEANEDKVYLCDLNYNMVIDEDSDEPEEWEYFSGVLPGDGLVYRNFKRVLVNTSGDVKLKLYDEQDNYLWEAEIKGSGRQECLLPSGLGVRGLGIKLNGNSEFRSLILEYEDIGI